MGSTRDGRYPLPAGLPAGLGVRADWPALRPRIRRSWIRSSLGGVDPGRGALAAAITDIDLESPAVRAAAPVVDDLEDRLAGGDWMVVLSDQNGRLTRLGRRQPAVRTRFQSVGAYLGAGAAEAQIGTNAIGTAIEDRGPILVVGPEHFQQGFQRVSCAAAAIRDPVTQRVLGALALAALDAEPGGHLLTLVTRAAREVERSLLELASTHDRLVLEAVKTRGRGTRRSVVGVTREVMVANDPGVRLLPRLDQASLWERARETVDSGREGWAEVPLRSDGPPLRVRCTPVQNTGETVGALLDFGAVDLAVTSLAGPSPALSPPPVSPRPLGAGTAHVRRGALDCPSREARALREQVAATARSTTSVLVSGEPGAGKQTIAAELLARRFPGAEHTVVSCWEPTDIETMLADRPGLPVILTHIEQLSERDSYRLRAWLRRLGPAASLIAVTMDRPAATDRPGSPLADELAGAVLDVPALRSRREDISGLADHFAVADGRARVILPEAMQILLRYAWPGNIRELRSVVRGACAASTADVGFEHLPAGVRRLATRRPLSPLEQAEADAILAALRACNNNKVRAASLLQISRARLYRKASAYGLVGALLD